MNSHIRAYINLKKLATGWRKMARDADKQARDILIAIEASQPTKRITRKR